MTLSSLTKSETPLREKHLPLPQTVPSTNTSSTEAQASLIALANIANLMEDSHVKMREALLKQAKKIQELTVENERLKHQLSQSPAKTNSVSQYSLSPSASVAKLRNVIQDQTATTEKKLKDLQHNEKDTISRSSLLSSDSTASLRGPTPEEKRAQRTQAAQECLKHLENAPEVWPFTFSLLKVTAFITNNFDKSEQDIYNKHTTNLREKWHAYKSIADSKDPNKQKAKRELLHEQKNVHSFLQTYASPQ